MIRSGSSDRSGSGSGGGNVDLDNTNALLKHLNFGSKLVSNNCLHARPFHLAAHVAQGRSPELSSQSPPLQPIAATSSSTSFAVITSAAPSPAAAATAVAVAAAAAPSAQSVLDALGSAFAMGSRQDVDLNQQQFRAMVSGSFSCNQMCLYCNISLRTKIFRSNTTENTFITPTVQVVTISIIHRHIQHSQDIHSLFRVILMLILLLFRSPIH
jgi:hypothetical protein